ncbi:MAG: N-acetylglucosamine-6-phosphate deacetylase [Candidatus Sumerlaeota bacterium]|nr:N-acetylglucosamine-6-phosphate deacetylase [Candidatus Sumerlaeota bacterium]
MKSSETRKNDAGMPSKKSQIISIQNGAVVLPDRVLSPGTVLIEGSKIAYVGGCRPTPRGAAEVDARGGIVSPGLIDVHFHGAGEHSLDPPDEASFRAIADILLKRGITQCLLGMMADESLIRGLSDLIEKTGLSRRIPGLMVEGPFVNVEKRGGIQTRFIQPVSLARLERLQRLARGKIVMMTFAPELKGADGLPRAMRRLGILPCVGHSTAACAQVEAVVGRSKIGMTHLFNAMSGVSHREPGVAVYGLTRDNAYIELNPDGCHVAPEVLDLVWRAKPHDKIILMSDAVIGAGLKPGGEYGYMGRTVVADERGVRYKDEGTLVGSRCLLNEGVARFMRFTGAPLEAAIRMASLNPAEMLGIARRKGSLAPGKDADVVIFSKNLAKAKLVFLAGQ